MVKFIIKPRMFAITVKVLPVAVAGKTTSNKHYQ